MLANADHQVTDALIRTTLGMSFERLPSDVVEKTKDLVLDHLGAAIYGSTMEWCRMVRATVDDDGTRRTSTLYGGGKTTARGAALVNGTSGHAMELDDTHDESLSHPGSVIMPAAFAAAESVGANGADVIVAIIAGYEVQCRIGAAISSRLVKRGFHPTAQLGVFGAAAAVARLMLLSPQQTRCALGIAGSMASGIMKFTQDPEGTMVKRLHAGLAAEHGLLAAQLAAKGFTGPREIIEGDFGYAKTFAQTDDLSRITENLEQHFEVLDISIKLFPCCRMFHALIEAIAKCRTRAGFSADRVETIEALGPDNMIEGHLERRPRSTMAAQYSLPYTTAVAVLGDAANPDSFMEAAMMRDDVLALADKVTARIDPKLQALYPRKYAAQVRFHMTDGTVIEDTVLDSRGTPAVPISRSDVEAKFRTLTSGLASTVRQQQIIAAVTSLGEAPDLSELLSLCGTQEAAIEG